MKLSSVSIFYILHLSISRQVIFGYLLYFKLLLFWIQLQLMFLLYYLLAPILIVQFLLILEDSLVGILLLRTIWTCISFIMSNLSNLRTYIYYTWTQWLIIISISLEPIRIKNIFFQPWSLSFSIMQIMYRPIIFN